jgi:hypothetical protein
MTVRIRINPMTKKITLAVEAFHDGKRVADHEAMMRGLDGTIPMTFARVMVDAWILAIGYSLCCYAAAASPARSHGEADADFTWALGLNDAGDALDGKPNASADRCDDEFVEELLASDRRRIGCKAFAGDAMSDLTMPLRQDMVLASSVVC